MFTGILLLKPEVADFVRRLLEPPDGLWFRKTMWSKKVDNKFEGVADLVEPLNTIISSVVRLLRRVDSSFATADRVSHSQ